jgi:hypothetical protein
MRCSRRTGMRAARRDSKPEVAIVGTGAILLNGGAEALALLFGPVLP